MLAFTFIHRVGPESFSLRAQTLTRTLRNLSAHHDKGEVLSSQEALRT